LLYLLFWFTISESIERAFAFQSLKEKTWEGKKEKKLSLLQRKLVKSQEIECMLEIVSNWPIMVAALD